MIDYHQLKVAIRALGFEIKKAEVLQLMDEHDPTGRGTIDYDAFVDIMALRIAARSPEEEMHKAFLLFAEDVGADGTKRISLKNMKEIAKELGENLTSDDLQAMIAEFDTDADGKISFEEFRGVRAARVVAGLCGPRPAHMQSYARADAQRSPDWPCSGPCACVATSPSFCRAFRRNHAVVVAVRLSSRPCVAECERLSSHACSRSDTYANTMKIVGIREETCGAPRRRHLLSVADPDPSARSTSMRVCDCRPCP